ncbi:MAG: hypothetical protein M3R15_10375, partial [Acidobacteriota bacterium]|nr:hypothetical protein [Acidobacteriota bacterium]
MELPLILIISFLSLACAGFVTSNVMTRRAAATGMRRHTLGLLREGASSFTRRWPLSGLQIPVALSTRAIGIAASGAVLLSSAVTALAQSPDAPPAHRPGGEANLILPDLSQVTFLGFDGRTLLMLGLVVCVLGLLFGLAIFIQLKNMPVHRSMRAISELIYETCKTYLITQGK